MSYPVRQPAAVNDVQPADAAHCEKPADPQDKQHYSALNAAITGSLTVTGQMYATACPQNIATSRAVMHDRKSRHHIQKQDQRRIHSAF